YLYFCISPTYTIMEKMLTNLFILMATVTAPVFGATRIQFDVSFNEPQAHYAEIQMEISGLKKDYIDVKMPVWTPGSYLIREYAKHVENVAAHNGSGDQLEVEKTNKNTWRIASDNSDVVILTYRVYGFEVSVRTNFIDDSHAFLSPEI